jgi:hypothetical protein
MATFEVETIYYTSQGGVKTKECDLFDSRNTALAYMRSKLSRSEMIKQGDIKDGVVKLLDERGNLRQVVKFGKL